MTALSKVDVLAAQHGDVQVLPTTFAQLRFWLLDQIGDDGGAFTIPMALRLEGPLNVAALERALNAIVERHEALRTLFVLEEEEPVQVVLPALRVQLTPTDLRHLSAEARERETKVRADANANLRFDLSVGPLFRASLLQLADEEHVLFMALHHIVGDGWSVGVLYREIETAYTAIINGRPLQLPDLPLQYADFAVWQRKAMLGGAAARQLSYWVDQLRGFPTLELATDRPRPALQSMNGGKRERILDRSVVDGMRALARNEGATPYMAFLAAFAALLHRYTSQPDLVIGSITSGRSKSEVEPLIGLFVNTLAMRVNADGNPTFVELLRRVASTATAAYANQDVPFEQVIDAVEPVRDRSRSPIFQVAFQLLEGLGSDLQLPGLRVSRVRGAKDTTKFDLTLMLHQAPQGALRAVLEYNSDLFDVETVDRMLEHFATLVANIVENPQGVLSQFPLMSASETETLLLGSRGPHSDEPAHCIHDMVAVSLEATPDAVAVSGADGSLTYAELDARSNRLAAHLRDSGVSAGHPVGICLTRNSDLVVALLAILKTGGFYVPLDPEYPTDRLSYILQDSAAQVVIASTTTADRLPASEATHVLMDRDRDLIAACSAAPVRVAVSPDQLAYVLHTSGSTGKPKGVMIPHRAVSNFLRSMAERPGLNAADAVVAVTTLSFDIAGLEIWLPLVTGARVVVAPRSVVIDGQALVQLVDETAATVRDSGGHVLLQATPATWRLMLDAGWTGTAGLRMLCGGEAWSADLAEALLARGDSLWNVYGPTETTIWSTVAHIHDPQAITLGSAIRNTSLMVLDAHRALVPSGVPGELYIGGDGVARGYLNRPDLTADRFVADVFSDTPGAVMYRTGDLVRRRNDGQLEYLNRIDQQVKLRGFRIELGEIETALAALPSVSQAVAVIWSKDSDARLVAYLIPSDAQNAPGVEEIRAHLSRTLPEYMIPLQFVMMANYPLTPNGKIDRKALPEPDPVTPSVATYIAPRTPTEQVVVGVWEQVLHLERIGISDGFFALGGNSLAATRVSVRLTAQLGFSVPVRVLFERSTPASLAEWLDGRTAEIAEEQFADMLAELDEMSDAEAEALLLREQRETS